MGLGGSLFVGALETGEWGTEQVNEVLPLAFTRWLWPLGWAGIAVLGCLSAMAVLGINPYAGVHLVFVPLLWAARALGFATFWMSPEVFQKRVMQVGRHPSFGNRGYTLLAR